MPPLPGPALMPETTPLPLDDAEVRAKLEEMIFASALPVELEGLTEADRSRLVDVAASLLAERPAGTHRVHVGGGEGEAGGRRMTIALLIDDMPFLVDSVGVAMDAEQIDVLRLLHPILHVRRDADGRLLSLGDPSAPRESLVLLETRRAPAKKRAAIAARLDHVYADIRAAVSDWQAMLALLRASARALNDQPPPIAPHVLAESIAFLDWLAADNFTLVGADDGDTRLGILRNAERWSPPRDPAPGMPATEPVTVRKSAQRSTVHRGVPLDIITICHYDADGRAVGAAHLLGLFTSEALGETPRRVPLVRRKVAEVAERLGYAPRSHDGRALQHVIDSFPREELFQLSTEELLAMASGLLSLNDRPRPRVFVRRDPIADRAAVFAYIPRDDYTADLRARLGQLIEKTTGGTIADFAVELRAEPLAHVQYRLEQVKTPPDADALTAALEQLTHGWEDALEHALAVRTTPTRAARLTLSHGRAFGPGYRAEFTPEEAAEDVLHLAELESPAERRIALSRRADDRPGEVRLRIYRRHDIIPLSETVPILENFGFRVVEEVPWELRHNGESGWIHAFRLELPAPPADFESFTALVGPPLRAVLEGRAENDSFNALIPGCGLGAEASNWLRAWFRYLRQTGISYGVQTVVDALRRNPEATVALVALFRARLSEGADEEAAAAALAAAAAALDAVEAIDDDRILRLFEGVIVAMLRTNAFTPGGPEALAFKLESARVPGLPKPLPWREIWVYSPRVEGIHLRAGPIARGGLRWSDRRDDFRTEILGLMKAQVVKNSVIVPTGAKGGFYPKLLPPPSAGRDRYAAEGEASYRIFIRALLSVTDNIGADGKVIPAPHIERRDGDDAYLVVAADKGTATFSDIANDIAEDRGFWLADAFASGGSAGYDHKAMGITARGAWISVRRHFAELGVDVATDPFTAVGVGDMSGDVFGNGMLLSQSIRLVAAFDHRHIFLDPAPDAAAAWAERRRLFDLPRSSWADYDPKLISKGGGVFPRTQKSIPLSAEVRAVLGIAAESLDPSALISAILRAPVDLLWFGGIGTYVKAADQTNAEVMDRANDAHRINGGEVRARVIGEGANLGVTQAGRIEYALTGGRINTDFIDNSAGVDTSDHEVNIKIALSAAERSGKLDRAERNELLRSMTDEVAALVLADNEAQTLSLSVAEAEGAAQLAAHARLMAALAQSGRLDRDVEGLPDARALEERRRLGRGLTRPELAILICYVKMDLKEALATSSVATDPLLGPDLVAAFPAAMRQDYQPEIEAHPLRRELVATEVANLMVKRGGLTLAHDLAGELGCSPVVVAGAFVAARTLFDLQGLWDAIDASGVAAAAVPGLHAEAAAAVRILVSDLARRDGAAEPAHLVAQLAPGLGRLLPRLDAVLRPEPRRLIDALRARWTAAGLPAAVTDRLAVLHALSGAAGVVALAGDLGSDEAATAEAYTMLGEALGIDWAGGVAAGLQPTDAWERLLIATTLRTLETMRLDLIRRQTPAGGDPVTAVGAWLAANAGRVQRISGMIAAARAGGPPTLAMVAHIASVAQATLAG